MPADYDEVMKDLEAREAKLLNELNTIRAAKPAIAVMQQAQQIETALHQAPTVKGKYAGMGNSAAVRSLFTNTSEALTREEIYSRLRADGWTSNAGDPLSSLSATLSQLKGDFLDKVEDRWMRKRPALSPRPVTDHPSPASEHEPPSWQSHSGAQA